MCADELIQFEQELEALLITPVEFVPPAPHAEAPPLRWIDRLRVVLTMRVKHGAPIYLHVLRPKVNSGEVSSCTTMT